MVTRRPLPLVILFPALVLAIARGAGPAVAEPGADDAATTAAVSVKSPPPPAEARPVIEKSEADYYDLLTISSPGLTMEVGGVAVLPDGRPIVCTRYGEVHIVENAYGDGVPEYKLFAEGLQEPLGLLVHDGWILTAQRGELTRMKDTDGDDRADIFETLCDDWELSGNYHEYAYGPVLDADGNYLVTLNIPFGDEPFGRAHWRGWAVRVTPQGDYRPLCTGLRSPAGLGVSPGGDAFFTDNQGEWIGTCKLSHMEEGDFHGHPFGLASCDLPASPMKSPGTIPSGPPMHETRKTIPSLKEPAVWFPYDKMGKSASGLLWDTTGGAFGPFAGQLFVGDQHHAWIMRVFLEKVDGHWQGACFRFRDGFSSGVLRMEWGADGSMLVGLTNRGWGSRGGRGWGLQRLVWKEETPFEIREMRALADGFALTFTSPADAESAADPASYSMKSYTYGLHSRYGSEETDTLPVNITGVRAGEDGLSVELTVEPFRTGYVHELHAPGLRSTGGLALLHPEAYYTLIRTPQAQ